MKYIKVGDRVRWKSIYGTVTSVLKNTFFVHWDDGDCSTEGIETYSLCGIELLSSKQDTLVEKYIQKIKDKYPEEEQDAINPKHYDLFPEHGIQVRELMQVLCDKLDRQGFSGFLCSDYVQAMQYFLRWFEKNGVEDIEKGIWYMNKIIKQVQEMEKL